MSGTERFLPDCQRPLVERLDVGVMPLNSVKRGQVVERRWKIGMIRTESFLVSQATAYSDGSAAAYPLVFVESRQAVQRPCNIRIIRTESLLLIANERL